MRGLLLLTAFVAVALVWWMQRNNRAASTSQIRLQVSGERASIVDSATGEVAAGGE
jgi:hypothetical protein